MANNVPIKCPVSHCDYSTTLRLEIHNSTTDIARARIEVKSEHPEHTSKSWKFRTVVVNKNKYLE